jgi:hypothetical protein
MKSKQEIMEHAAKIIEREVRFFRGWYVSDETMRAACRKSAKKVRAYLIRRLK